MNAVKIRWDAAEEDHLLFLRDRERLDFDAIGLRLGRTGSACEVRYYGRLYGRNGARHQGVFRPAVVPMVVKVPARPVMQRPPAPMSPARPIGSNHRASDLGALRDCTELLARIAERGLTGGVFGDPKPGASALDKRLQGRQAPLQPSLAGGGSDGL